MARNPSTRPRTLRSLVRDEELHVALVAAQHEGADSTVLAVAAVHPSVLVREIAAKGPIDADTAARLMADPEAAVLRALAQNPAVLGRSRVFAFFAAGTE